MNSSPANTSTTQCSMNVAAKPTTNLPRRRRVGWLMGCVALAIAAVIADGAWRKPADPSGILTLNEAERVDDHLDSAPTLRVATFNIHAGAGRDGIRNLHRTADCLPNLDIVALEEVRNPLFQSHGPQAAEISDLLNMAWMFVPTERRWWHDHYGNALLTRAPLDATIRIPLPTSNPTRFRAALLANVRFHNRTVHVIAAHLDTPLQSETHDLQLRTICDLFRSISEPAILMGDFNEVAAHPEIVRLLATPGVHNALAGVSRDGVRKTPVDWIFTKGFHTVRGEWRENSASDHPVALAELELLEPTVAQSNEPIPAKLDGVVNVPYFVEAR